MQDKYAQTGLEVTIVEIQQRHSHASRCINQSLSSSAVNITWFDLFNELILNLLTRGKPIIMGDINADILRPMSYAGNLILNTMALAGTRPVSTAPTRVTQTTAMCIDIIAVNEDLVVTQSNVIHRATSDHYPVTASVVLTEPQKLAPIIKHSFDKVDLYELADRVEQIGISHLNPTSPEHLYKEWFDSFTDILDTIALHRKFPMRQHRSPWLNAEI